jgi:hypothetical protein
VTSDGYPETVGPFVYDNTQEGLQQALHKRAHKKTPLLYYNMETQMITSCCQEWLDLFKDEARACKDNSIAIVQ